MVLVKRLQQNNRRNAYIVCLAIWCIFNNVAFTIASESSTNVGESENNGRKGMQRVRRKLRHRGLQSKLRAAPGGRNSTQAGNIFLSREKKEGKKITRIDHIEDKVPRRVVSPYEVGVKGQGYLLRGHENEATKWSSARDSNETQSAELKVKLPKEGTAQPPFVATSESSMTQKGKRRQSRGSGLLAKIPRKRPLARKKVQKFEKALWKLPA